MRNAGEKEEAIISRVLSASISLNAKFLNYLSTIG